MNVRNWSVQIGVVSLFSFPIISVATLTITWGWGGVQSSAFSEVTLNEN